MNYDTAYDAPASETLASGLGWFSVALGVAELAAPHSVARLIGVAPTEKTIATLRSYGAREVGAGMAILAQPDRAAWLWARVAGDALDLATLGAAMGSSDTDRRRATLAAVAVLGVTALDVMCARQLQEGGGNGHSNRFSAGRGKGLLARGDSTVRVAEAVTINQPLELVEHHWNHHEAMPESLRSLGRSHSGADERAIEAQAIAGADGGGLVRETGAVHRAVEPITRAVTGENAAGAVRAVGGGCEPEHVDRGVRVAEAGHWPAPVLLVREGGALLARDPLAPFDQARAAAAGRDAPLELREPAGVPGLRQALSLRPLANRYCAHR